MIPVRAGRAAMQFAQTFQRWGARLIEMSADEHDRCMAIVQVISHAAILAIAATTADSRLPHDWLRSTTTPVRAALESLIARVTAGDPTMYWDIQRDNPHGEAARRALAQSLDRLRGAVDANDYQAFLQLVSEARGAVQ
jgi:prephenate dehydrogenase